MSNQPRNFVNLTCLLLSALLLAACPNKQASSQPTAKPKAASSWNGESSMNAGALDGGCDIGGITAIPGLSSWAYTEKRDVCLIRLLSANKQKKEDWALGPIDDCGALSEVGDLTLSTSGPTPLLYVLGSMSVSRVIDESGVMSFEGGTASRLFQIDTSSPSNLKMLDTTETLRRLLLEEFQRWNKELEASGLGIERELKSMQVGGLAAAPNGDFLLALRSPLICPVDGNKREECRAILLLVSDLGGLFQKKPEVELKARAMLSLDGAGVASLEYEPLTEGFLVTTTDGKARLLRYQDALVAIKMRDITPRQTDVLRAVVPAPGGAAAFFIGERSAKEQCKLSWEPITIEQLDGVER
jgi:hypothetical protein